MAEDPGKLQLQTQNEAHSEKINLKRKLQDSNKDVSNTVDSKKSSRTFEAAYYDETEEGNFADFLVLIDSLEEFEINGLKKFARINTIKLFQILESLKLNEGILRIKKIGYKRAKILVKSAKDANNIVKRSEDLLKNKLRPFIPLNFVYKFGIVKDIPLEISEKKILENIQSDIPIHSISRMTRFDAESNSRVNTNSIKIAFKGPSIPDEIFIFLSASKVKYFIPKTKQCLKCGRLGHLANFCKSTEKRCLKCGKKGENCIPNCDKKVQLCLLCGGKDHTCIDKIEKCPKKIEYSKINEIMAIGNLSFNEVKEQYNTNNPFEILTDYDEEFPELPKRTPKTKNNLEEINKTLRKHTKFNKIIPKKQLTIPVRNNLIQGEAIDVPSQSAFSIHLSTVSEIEKILNLCMVKLSETADKLNNEEIRKSLEKCKQNINYTSILFDKAEIDAAASPNNTK